MTKRYPNNIRIKEDDPYYSMSYKGYISPARYTMAQNINRCLGSDEYIYFLDGNPFNYDISNMQLVSHKELTQLNQIRRITRQIDNLKIQLDNHYRILSDIRFNHTPCDCPRCIRSREARQAAYRL